MRVIPYRRVSLWLSCLVVFCCCAGAAFGSDQPARGGLGCPRTEVTTYGGGNQYVGISAYTGCGGFNYEMWAIALPCSSGGTASGLLTPWTSGSLTGNSFSGSGNGTSITGSISGDGKTMTGTVTVSVGGLTDSGGMCGVQASPFTAQCTGCTSRGKVEITSATPVPLPQCQRPTQRGCTYNDGTYFSIPPSGQTNVNQRWFDVRFKVLDNGTNITSQTTLSNVRVDLESAAGADLQEKIVNGGKGQAVREKGTGQLEVRVTFASLRSSVDSTPPPTDRIVYRFTVTVNEPRAGDLSSDPYNSAPMHALWKMPDGLPRFSPCEPQPHEAESDDWVSAGTYSWMETNRGLLTAINDATGEHGLNLGHVSHATGNDLDLFHIYALPGASTCVGGAYYNTLVATVRQAFGNGPQAAIARQQVANWVTITRNRFDTFLVMARVRLIIYAKGDAVPGLFRRPPQNGTGWAEDLLRDGSCTDIHGRVINVAGPWANAHNRKMEFRTDHDDHVHLSLNP
jgi:hypothetical protein